MKRLILAVLALTGCAHSHAAGDVTCKSASYAWGGAQSYGHSTNAQVSSVGKEECHTWTQAEVDREGGINATPQPVTAPVANVAPVPAVDSDDEAAALKRLEDIRARKAADAAAKLAAIPPSATDPAYQAWKEAKLLKEYQDEQIASAAAAKEALRLKEQREKSPVQLDTEEYAKARRGDDSACDSQPTARLRTLCLVFVKNNKT
jgi:hypothetical protein